ncbi:MAG: MFS transporter [Rhodospirillales bacterium]|nr:MFS transporter [Rhodospirillales bacterium]
MSGGEKITGGLSDQRVINFLLFAVAGMGMVIGMTFPLVTLSLERMNFGAVLIGLNSATGSLGILLVGLFTGHFLNKHGAFSMMIAACLLSIVSLMLMPLTGFAAGWFILRFLIALGLGFLWLISEAWLNVLAGNEKRGQIMGLYGMAFSGGFASGPLLVSIIGSEGWEPFAITAAILLFSVMPMIFLAGTRDTVEEEETGGHFRILGIGAFIFLVAFAAGMYETTAYALLPVYTLREGLGESWSLYALSALSAGGIVMQYPMGRLADSMGRYALMVAIALGILLTVIAIPYSIHSYPLLLVVLFLFGGSIFGLYTLGLIMLGDKFGAGSLVVANSVFIILYEAGGVFGPTLAGAAMDVWPHSGFIGFLVVSAIAFAGLTVMRRKN